MRIILFQVLILAINVQLAFCQLSENKSKLSLLHIDTVVSGKTIEIPSIEEIEKLVEEDFKRDSLGLPYRSGVSYTAMLNIIQEGNWVIVNDTIKALKLNVISDGAKYISLLFDKFWLTKSAELYVYQTNGIDCLGPFTSKNNKGTQAHPRGFAISPLSGDNLTLLILEPIISATHSTIQIKSVVRGYRSVFGTTESFKNEGFGSSASCEVNINCSQGADWQDEKKGVARILLGGAFSCTGALINNTTKDGELYFLTADHCIDLLSLDASTDPDGSDIIFYWNYESADCTNGSDFTPPSTQGCTVVANLNFSEGGDLALLKLDESPFDLNLGLNPYFCGWDVTDDVPNNVVCVHHPQFDIKKISGKNGNIQKYYLNQVYDWRFSDWDYGTIEPGSSGAPLYSELGKIIGVAQGSVDACDNAGENRFTRLGPVWNSYSDVTMNFSHWLDPISSGQTQLSGGYLLDCSPYDLIINTPQTASRFEKIEHKIEISSTFQSGLNSKLKAGAFIEMLPGFSAADTYVAEIESCPSVQSNKTSMANGITSFDVLNRDNVWLFPNPSSYTCQVEFNSSETKLVSIVLLNLLGSEVKLAESFPVVAGNSSFKFNTSNYAAGIYFVRISDGNNAVTKKLVIEH